MFCAVALVVAALTPTCDVVRDYGAGPSPALVPSDEES